jgi:hypothetical protein
MTVVWKGGEHATAQKTEVQAFSSALNRRKESLQKK